MNKINPDAVENIIQCIRTSEYIELETSFQYAKLCSELLRGNHHNQTYGRKIIINILDNWKKIDTLAYEMWTDLIESAGFYPYLQKEKEKLPFKNTAGEIRKEFHRSSNLDKYFHEEQRFLNEILDSDQNLIVSAPTSFGKSLLIEEVVASLKYRNIVVIQPTLALLNETRKKLTKYKNNYKIIIRTSQNPSEEKGNLFLLTAERVMEYQSFPNIDFFVVDEFYKLSAKRDDERSDTLNNAFNLLVNKHESRFYLLGPNIEGISDGFAEKYNALFYKTNYSLVDCVTIDCYSDKYGKSGTKKKIKEEKLFELLLELKDEQTIIYCSSPNRARYLAVEFQKYLHNKGIVFSNPKLSIIKWIQINIYLKWNLISCLNNRIGVHDGALPKHIPNAIIKYFNEKKLKYLFCTTTIIEGVNTSAKNVVFFDPYKGKNIEIDFFDYSNIRGRAGRMMEHYVGRIFTFNTPIAEEKTIIDIPFFEQNPVSDEVLVQIDDKDIKDKKSEQYQNLKKIPLDEIELFKKNGTSIKGQKAILDCLMENVYQNYDLIKWNRYPKYKQLEFVLSLAWDHLLKPTESTRPMTKKKLVKNTFDYGYHKNIKYIIKSSIDYQKKQKANKNKSIHEVINKVIQETFQISRHWFHYKVPKWLNVINELQKFVCEKKGLDPGNYSFYAMQIENDFIPENLLILSEYGIPTSGIKKLSDKIPENINEEDILSFIKNKDLINHSKLIEYEKQKFRENF